MQRILGKMKKKREKIEIKNIQRNRGGFIRCIAAELRICTG